MAETDGLPITIETEDIEQHINPYAGIDQLAVWVESNMSSDGRKNELEGVTGPVLVTEKVSKCLPIEKGSGNATIAQQIDYWGAHQNDFISFLKRRELAAELVKSRRETIERKVYTEQDLHLKKTTLDFISEDEQEMYPNEVAELRKETEALIQEVEAYKKTLDDTETEFTGNREMLKTITSHIDCKLPTVIAGHILQKMGWNVGLISVIHPEHPTLIASRDDSGESTIYAIGFNGNPSEFRSLPVIRKGVSIADLSGARSRAIRTGLITDQDPWPLPFTEEGLKKFDDWFSAHHQKTATTTEVPDGTS